MTYWTILVHVECDVGKINQPIWFVQPTMIPLEWTQTHPPASCFAIRKGCEEVCNISASAWSVGCLLFKRLIAEQSYLVKALAIFLKFPLLFSNIKFHQKVRTVG